MNVERRGCGEKGEQMMREKHEIEDSGVRDALERKSSRPICI